MRQDIRPIHSPDLSLVVRLAALKVGCFGEVQYLSTANRVGPAIVQS
jgi:hypothetical protein